MTLGFDDVIPKLLEYSPSNAALAASEQIAVVRDPKGIVRLAMAAPNASVAERNELEETLTAALGAWYSGPVLYTDAEAPQKKIAAEVIKQAKGKWPASWPREAIAPITGTRTALDLSKWGAVQRVLSKETWLTEQAVASPWPLHERTPTIVSFYSYKGGVGRSTLVAVVAAILARAGEKVVIVDLDLEAPGQQALFDSNPSRGVIDYVVEHLALGSSDLDGLLMDVTSQVREAKASIHLAAAGALRWSFVEKIARLDFVGHTQAGQSPVQAALVSLLKSIKAKNNPKWILLDARTGIHDLGGLAMHALAHIDVLLARDGRQGREGLELCLEALARRRKAEDILTLVVHALAPAPLDDEIVSKPVQERFRHAVYDLFKKTVYQEIEDADLPAEDDDSAAHAPYSVPLDPTLGRLELLSSMSDLPDRPHYSAIVARLRELASTEDT